MSTAPSQLTGSEARAHTHAHMHTLSVEIHHILPGVSQQGNFSLFFVIYSYTHWSDLCSFNFHLILSLGVSNFILCDRIYHNAVVYSLSNHNHFGYSGEINILFWNLGAAN